MARTKLTRSFTSYTVNYRLISVDSEGNPQTEQKTLIITEKVNPEDETALAKIIRKQENIPANTIIFIDEVTAEKGNYDMPIMDYQAAARLRKLQPVLYGSAFALVKTLLELSEIDEGMPDNEKFPLDDFNEKVESLVEELRKNYE